MSRVDRYKRYMAKMREYTQFGIIYKATLITDGRTYIGQTVRSFKKRISEHLTSTKGQFYFQNSLKKHGSENFIWEIIDFADNQEELDRKESSWILHYKSNVKGFGFNLTCGGEHMVFNEETKNRISEKMTGEKNHRFGLKWSEETRAKNTISRKGMQNNNKKVKCVETNKIYKSIKEAVEQTGISFRQIDRLLKSGKKSRKFGISFVKLGGVSSLT